MTGNNATKQSPWQHALKLADQTPASRNRYADFLRAASILVVVLGHWLMAAPWAHGTPDPEIELGHVLAFSPWTHWLTWVLQVMPVFFVVGGFSNSISWQKAIERQQSYAQWLDSRLRRLMAPILPLLAAWALLGAGAQFAKIAPATLRVGSQVALVPTWFLAVYLLVILAVPLTFKLWQRLGMWSVVLIGGVAVLLDLAAFAGGVTALRWLNYGFVWAAVHQLGYAWRAKSLDGWRRLAMAGGGLGALLALVFFGPFPVSMVGVPGEEISNSLPPTVALLALGVFQAGVLLSFEARARRWLEKRSAWAATVLVNANIMTLYLWHSTVLVLGIGALVALDGLALGIEPASGAWWLSRPLWVLALAVCLAPFLTIFGRFERSAPRGGATPGALRLLASSLLFCSGIALLAFAGVGGGRLGVRVFVLALPFAGALVAGMLPGFTRTRSS